MNIDIKVPDLGESISDVEVGEWFREVGERVEKDDPLVEIESEKATVEVPAPATGTVGSIIKSTGKPAKIGEVIGTLIVEEGVQAEPVTAESAQPVDAAPPAAQPSAPSPPSKAEAPRVMPAAQRMMEQHHVAAEKVQPTGPGQRVLKEDVARVLDQPVAPTSPPQQSGEGMGRTERVERMTLLRRTTAKRLVQAQHESAILTTFNEIDMHRVKSVRAELGKAFEAKYGVRLGFMSFFVRASCESLRDFPQINAYIQDDTIVFHDYCDVGVAIGGGKGLVVPILRNADQLSFAEIEKRIADFAKRANDSTLGVDELQGGTFTISNGGVYGSMLSTPIINPPQSGILGLHAIKDRAVVVGGEIVVRPVMYVALSYDHRIVDGREAVSFLKGIKERIEHPARLLLEV